MLPTLSVLLTALLLLGASGCSKKQPPGGSGAPTLGATAVGPVTPTASPEPGRSARTATDAATEIARALKTKDMAKVAAYVDAARKLRFSPYGNVKPERDLTFTPSQVRDLFTDDTVRRWGSDPGSGAPIELTFGQYYGRYVYDKDFAGARDVHADRELRADAPPSNTLNNEFEVYPGSTVVEYYVPGSDPRYGGLDWAALRLVLDPKDDSWVLLGIIHDQWTP